MNGSKGTGGAVGTRDEAIKSVSMKRSTGGIPTSSLERVKCHGLPAMQQAATVTLCRFESGPVPLIDRRKEGGGDG